MNQSVPLTLTTPQHGADLADLLRNVDRGETLCELHARMMEALYASPSGDARALRARLLPLLTQMRVAAAAVAGIA